MSCFPSLLVLLPGGPCLPSNLTGFRAQPPGPAMSNLMKGKVYGLSMNKKVSTMPHLHNPLNPLMAKSKLNKPSIFGAEEESDSDEGGGDDWVKKAMMTKKETKLKKQTKNSMAAALEEDPTVFQYDEVYDDLEQKKEVEKESKKDVDRKPKYMEALLKSAKEREQEFERRYITSAFLIFNVCSLLSAL